MKGIDELEALVKKSMDLDPWVRNKSMEGYFLEIRKEAEEVIEASDKKDFENLKEELGDVLYDWMHACLLAQEQGLFTAEDAIRSAVEKIKRRKPYLLEGRKVTEEEAVRIWYAAKEKERDAKRQ